jgi:hypothetical protein
MVKGSTEPGPGIENADFVFYISAMETERCQVSPNFSFSAIQDSAKISLVVLYCQELSVNSTIWEYHKEAQGPVLKITDLSFTDSVVS